MARTLSVAAAQLGPIPFCTPRTTAVSRLVGLLEQAAAKGARLVVFPELALTSFFPRHHLEPADLAPFFETEMPGPETQQLFDAARDLKVGFYLGYAERAEVEAPAMGFNTAILVDESGEIVGKYRKVHLPGHSSYEAQRPWQHLEKRYFAVGDLGFPVWRTMGGILGMCLCNDRRWPETFRVMGLQGVELVMLGYNTPAANAVGQEPVHLRQFHSDLTTQAGAYQNGSWVVSTAKAGREDGVDMIGGSIIVAPSGEVVARTHTLDDEVIVADCDLDACQFNKTTIFNFAAHRRIEHYGIITRQAGASLPEDG
jgi:predicted amidohydrolase